MQSSLTTNRSLISRAAATIATLLMLWAAQGAAQTPPAGSLADAARQARAQKPTQPTADTKAQQMANELSENQSTKDAPGGFKAYDAGAYQLWLPAPYSVSGQDNGGTVLSGPRVVRTTPLVLIGNTLVLHSIAGDEALRDASTQFARGYAQDAICTKVTIANHEAYQCSLAGANLLGRSVSGNAVFLRASANVFPVFCVATTDSAARDVLNNPYSTYSQKLYARRVLAQENEYVRGVWQNCDKVFQSIQLKENAGAPPNAAPARDTATSTATAVPQKASVAPSSGGEGAAGAPNSLADIARGLQQHHPAAGGATASHANAPWQSTVPAGFKIHAFNYCKSARECWDASVLVPADAHLISSDCQQYVFEIKVKGESFLLMAGPGGGDGCQGRSPNDANLVRWEQLVAPESARAPGTASTISDQQTTLDGKPAVVTKIRFRKGSADWIGKRAEVASNGIPLVVGCMSGKDNFADGDEICSALIESLRLP